MIGEISIRHDDLLKRITLPIQLTNYNDGQTRHFGMSASQRKKYEKIIRAKFGQQKPFDVPVRILVVRVLGKGQRLWDYSSVLRGNWKQIEDALVACGFLHDDGPQYVTLVVGVQDASDRTRESCTEVLFYPLQPSARITDGQRIKRTLRYKASPTDSV